MGSGSSKKKHVKSRELTNKLLARDKPPLDVANKQCCRPKKSYCRYVLTLMCFLGFALVYMMRVNLSVAVVKMEPQFRWDKDKTDPKGLVLSTFFIGYIFGQIPGGYLASRFGGKWVLGVGILCTSVFTLVLPLATCGNFLCYPYETASCHPQNEANFALATSLNNVSSISDCYSVCLNTCSFGNGSACVNNTNSCNEECVIADYCSHFAFDHDTKSCALFSGCASVPQNQEELKRVNANSNLPALYALRIAMGLFESVTYPALYALLSMWTPSSERSIMVGITQAGAWAGTSIAFPICGIETSSNLPFVGGWPGVFYTFAVAGLLWSAVWFAITHSTPESSPCISDAERIYIVNTRKEDSEEGVKKIDKSDALKVPCFIWRVVLTHPSALITYCNHFANNWLNYTLLTWLPTFLDKQFGFDLKGAGGVESLPYLMIMVMCTVTGLIADAMINSSIAFWTRVRVRRFFGILSLLLPSILLVSMGFATSQVTGVILMTTAIGLNGFAAAGYNAIYLDLLPGYSSVVFSISNTIATIPGIVSPILTGLLLDPDHPTSWQWREVFFIAAGINTIALVAWSFVVAKPIYDDEKNEKIDFKVIC